MKESLLSQQIENKEKIKKDIIFIDPPIHTDQELAYARLDDSLHGKEIPKGAHSIANFLQEENIDSTVIITDSFLKSDDYEISTEEKLNKSLEKLIEKKLVEFDSPLVALNLMYTFTEPTILNMSRFIKEKYPDKKIIVGGNHATFCSDYLLNPRNNTGIDVVVRGEGEWTTKKLINDLNGGGNLSEIDGISYRDINNMVMHNKPRERGDLKMIPPFDYSLIDKSEKDDILNFNHTVMFARACKGNCAFCTSPEMWTRKVDNVAVENFQQEIEFLLKNDIDLIAILDDDLLVTKEIFEKMIQPLIKSKEEYPNVNFLAQARLDHFTNKKYPSVIIDQMVDAGIKRLYLGIESGSQTILNNMRKGIKVEQIMEACGNIKNFSKNQIEVGAFWLLGHPGATEETEEESLRLLEGLLKGSFIDDLEIHNTVPFPGTAISTDPRVKIFDYDKKHYGFLNNYPVYDLVDKDNQNKIILSATQIKEFQDQALILREKYLGISREMPNKPVN